VAVDETYVRVKGRWCYLYRAVAALDVLVVFLDRLLSDVPRVKVVVVQICHHLSRDPMPSSPEK